MGATCGTSTDVQRVSQEIVKSWPKISEQQLNNNEQSQGRIVNKELLNSQQNKNLDQQMQQLLVDNQFFKQKIEQQQSQINELRNELQMMKNPQDQPKNNQIYDFMKHDQDNNQMNLQGLSQTVEQFREQLNLLTEQMQEIKHIEFHEIKRQIIDNVEKQCLDTQDYCDQQCTQNRTKVKQEIDKCEFKKIAISQLQYTKKIKQGDENLQEQINKLKHQLETQRDILTKQVNAILNDYPLKQKRPIIYSIIQQ